MKCKYLRTYMKVKNKYSSFKQLPTFNEPRETKHINNLISTGAKLRTYVLKITKCELDSLTNA